MELQIFLSAEWSLRSDAECTRGVIYSLPGWPVSRQKIAVAQKFYHFIFAGIKITSMSKWEPSFTPFSTDYTITVKAAVRAVKSAGIQPVLGFILV